MGAAATHCAESSLDVKESKEVRSHHLEESLSETSSKDPKAVPGQLACNTCYGCVSELGAGQQVLTEGGQLSTSPQFQKGQFPSPSSPKVSSPSRHFSRVASIWDKESCQQEPHDGSVVVDLPVAGGATTTGLQVCSTAIATFGPHSIFSVLLCRADLVELSQELAREKWASVEKSPRPVGKNTLLNARIPSLGQIENLSDQDSDCSPRDEPPAPLDSPSGRQVKAKGFLDEAFSLVGAEGALPNLPKDEADTTFLSLQAFAQFCANTLDD